MENSGGIGVCEATQRSGECVTVKTELPPRILVLKEVAARLRKYALAPLEWFRLTAIHGRDEHWLADDFYDDQGEARQPKAAVPGAPHLAFPNREWFLEEPGRLLDLAAVRTWLEPADLGIVYADAFSRWTSAEIYDGLQRALKQPRCETVKSDLLRSARYLDQEHRLDLLRSQGARLKDVEDRVHFLTMIGLTSEAVDAFWAAVRPDKKQIPGRFALSLLCAGVPRPIALETVARYFTLVDTAEWGLDARWSLVEHRGAELLEFIEHWAARSDAPEWGALAAVCGLRASTLARWLQRGDLTQTAVAAAQVALGLVERSISESIRSVDHTLRFDIPREELWQAFDSGALVLTAEERAKVRQAIGIATP